MAVRDMVDINDQDWMQTVSDRLTRLEERGVARDERMARLEASIEKLVVAVQMLSDEVKAAKTGLRVGMGIMTTFGGIVGWLLSHFSLGK